MEEVTIEELYTNDSDGNLSIEDLAKLKKTFRLTCLKCGSDDVAIITKKDNDGYCETCSHPYAIAVLKCTKCGAAVGIKDY